jgi:hypothetical protein
LVALGQIFPESIGEFKTIRVGGRTDTTNRLSESLKRKPSVKNGALSDSFNISKKRVD